MLSSMTTHHLRFCGCRPPPHPSFSSSSLFLFSRKPLHSSSIHSRRLHSRLHARRKVKDDSPAVEKEQEGVRDSTATAAAAAAAAEEEDDGRGDEDLRATLNEISTEAVKVMLSDNMERMEALLEKLDQLEEFLRLEKEVSGALLFVTVVKGMLDHRALPQINDLKGSYKRAFNKIFSLVEDSGWVLKGDGDELGARMLDDELIPPTVMSQYN